MHGTGSHCIPRSPGPLVTTTAHSGQMEDTVVGVGGGREQVMLYCTGSHGRVHRSPEAAAEASGEARNHRPGQEDTGRKVGAGRGSTAGPAVLPRLQATPGQAKKVLHSPAHD